jgi:hypothetical protein
MKGGNIAIHYSLIIAHLLLVTGFGIMLINKLANQSQSTTKMMTLYSLISIELSFIISFIMSLFNSHLTIVYKIIYLVLVCIVGSMIVMQLDGLTENFCPTEFKEDQNYKAYYQKVMNRNQNDLMSPWKEVYQTKGLRNGTNIMPLKNNYF